MVGDRELIARMIGGDRDALEWLFDRHAPDLFGIANWLTTSSSTAEDLLHDTFLGLMHDTAIPLDEATSVERWLRSRLVAMARARPISARSEPQGDHDVRVGPSMPTTRS